MRVLQWMVGRLEGAAQGRENAFGTTPRYADLNWTGLNFTPAQFDQVTSLDARDWKAELGLHAELFRQLAHHLPAEMNATKATIEKRLAA
jgi:phosphoenolpyruvate carboxykinase (GTP)